MFGLTPVRRESMLAPTPLEALRREFVSLFDRAFPEWPLAFEPLTETLKAHAFRWEEAEKEYVLTADLPGFAPEEIDVTVRGEELTVKAEQKVEEKEGEKPAEMKRAKVIRTVTLPEDADPEKITAKHVHGVIELRVPKAEKAMPRKIEVKV